MDGTRLLEESDVSAWLRNRNALQSTQAEQRQLSGSKRRVSIYSMPYHALATCRAWLTIVPRSSKEVQRCQISSVPSVVPCVTTTKPTSLDIRQTNVAPHYSPVPGNSRATSRSQSTTFSIMDSQSDCCRGMDPLQTL